MKMAFGNRDSVNIGAQPLRDQVTIRGILFVLLFALWGTAGVHAQGTQCRFVPPGTSTSYCASEATVAGSRGTLSPGTFSALAACTSSNEGSTADVTDSTTQTFGAIVTGGGSFHVLAYCNGANWTVAGGGAQPGTGDGTVTSVAAGGMAVASPSPITGSGSITVTAAVKTDQTTATSNSVAVTPGVQQYHPSAAKAWAEFTGSSTNGSQTINSSFNVASVSRTAAGAYTVTFTTSFTSAHYACVGASYQGGIINGFVQFQSAAAGSIEEAFINISGPAAFDPTNGASVACFGTE